MKKKKISHIVFPFIESCYALMKWFLFFLVNENWKNYIQFRSQERRMIILANGPSLKEWSLSSADEADYCMVNNSPLSALFFKVRPKYHVMIDPNFFQKEQTDLIERLKLVSWDMTLFVPYMDRKQALRQYEINSYIRVVPIHCTGLPDTFTFHKLAFRLFRKGRTMPFPQNVLVAAVYCMINSGYKQIELYGADHSWISQTVVDEQNRLCRKDVHYYDIGTKVEYVPMPDINGERDNICQELRAQANTFGAYQMLQRYALSLGVTIINKTKGSFIDAFPRE